MLGPCCGTGAMGAPTTRPSCAGMRREALSGRDSKHGSRSIMPTGALGAGQWTWFSRTRAPRVGGSLGPATRAGPDGDLPGRGKMRAQSEAALLGWPPCSARQQETGELWKDGPAGPAGPAMAAQGGATAVWHHLCHKLVGCLSVAKLGGSAEAPPLAPRSLTLTV